MNTANDEGQAKQAYEEVVECIGIAKKNRKKDLNFFLPYDFTEMAASLLEDLLKESGYQVAIKSFPTRIGRAYIVHVKIQ